MSHWKNTLIKGWVRAAYPFQSKGKDDHFLIVSTTGLGDTLWGTPAIRALRQSYPEAYIGCLTSRLGSEVLKNNPYLSELLVFENSHSLFKLFFQLKNRQWGTALLFHASQRSILPLCASLGIQRRIGTQGLQKGLDDLLTQALPWTSGHEIERRIDLVRAVGAQPSSYDIDFFIQESDRTAAREIIPEERVIGLHPGAKDRFKQWPLEHFIKVGKRLKEELGCTIVVSGAASEKALVESICQQIEGARAVIEPLSIMAGILEKLSLFITNDTGPLHLALAMRTPTIALFTPTDPAICGPYHNESAQVIQAQPTCFPCLKKRCRDPFCLRQIGPDEVISAALEKMKVLI